MKKKLLIFALLICCLFGLTACGQANVNLCDYVIEERENLFVGQDELYSVTLSCGMRESNYCLDGVKTDMVEFGILTLARLNHNALANDTYTYTITAGEQTYTGELIKSEVDNSYVADIQAKIPNDAVVNASIKFTGYTFNKDLENVSNCFTVNKTQALEIANKELKNEIKTINNESKFEVVTKILKDYSTEELKTYYWYVGVVSTNGSTLGVLIDATNGNIVAKKV